MTAVGSAHEDHDECPVCFESIDDAELKLPCGHPLCNQCKLKWSAIGNSCPLCRSVIHATVTQKKVDNIIRQIYNYNHLNINNVHEFEEYDSDLDEAEAEATPRIFSSSHVRGGLSILRTPFRFFRARRISHLPPSIRL